jgi:hypothetical protein
LVPKSFVGVTYLWYQLSGGWGRKISNSSTAWLYRQTPSPRNVVWQFKKKILNSF